MRNHFDTEASDAGLRSLDLASTGGGSGSRSYDKSAVARADRAVFCKMFGDENTHRHVRETLKKLDSRHVELLSLAYEHRLRLRDIEDSKKRKALPQHERNWRVRLAELYGQDGAIILASPVAKELFAKHVGELREASTDGARATDGGLIAWLIGPGSVYVTTIDADARKRLNAALDAFAAEHGIADRHDTQTPRHRSSEKTRARILASFPENGHEIGG